RGHPDLPGGAEAGRNPRTDADRWHAGSPDAVERSAVPHAVGDPVRVALDSADELGAAVLRPDAIDRGLVPGSALAGVAVNRAVDRRLGGQHAQYTCVFGLGRAVTIGFLIPPDSYPGSPAQRDVT